MSMIELTEFIALESGMGEADRKMLSALAIAFNRCLDPFIMLESMHVPAGIERIAEIIDEACFNHRPSGSFTLKADDFQGVDRRDIFFKEIHISFSPGKDDEAYFNEKKATVNSDGKIDEIHIGYQFGGAFYIKGRNVDLLMHELVHAYDYIHYVKAIGMGHTASKRISYNAAEKNKETSLAALILYMCDRNERNAYTAQMQRQLHDAKTKTNDPMKALSIVKKLDPYAAYAYIYDEIFSDDMTEERKNSIADAFNYIYELYYNDRNRNGLTNFGKEFKKLTVNDAFKKLQFLVRKAKEHFDRVLPRMCVEHLGEYHGASRSIPRISYD